MEYSDFLKSKKKSVSQTGLDISRNDINPILFDFQKDIVKWSIKQGKNGVFAMTGLGKTFIECEYARIITENDKNNRVLMCAPLAVSKQTIREAEKLNIGISNLRHNEPLHNINIINYEQLNNIDLSQFNTIILDESSILKNYSGKIRNDIINEFKNYSYKLPCSATPAPNDFMELGNHSEFLDVMSRVEMLSMFFIHDSGNTQKWRLKGHADDLFWKWIASWSALITKPSDFGYDDKKFDLPPLNIIDHVVKSDNILEGHLFSKQAETLMERRSARSQSIKNRVKLAADIVNKSNEIFIVWCNLNSESEMLKKEIKNSVEIKGSDSLEYKEKNMLDFSDSKIKCLITKPKIAGHGMNWQNSHNQVFVGLSDSFEEYFQAVRRQYRFGQTKPVNVHIVTSDLEGNIVKNIQRKEKQAMDMIQGMIEHTKNYVLENIKENKQKDFIIKANSKMKLPEFLLAN